MKKKHILYLILLLFSVCVIYDYLKIYNTEDTHDDNGFPIDPVFYDNFLDDNDINILLNSCDNYRYSEVKNEDGSMIKDKGRTSTSCFIPKSKTKAYTLIKEKIKNIFNFECELEDLQLTKYNGGEFYNPHYDYFKKLPSHEKQRLKTIFVYLKEPIEGGETEFPKINKKFAPKKGGAVMWTNCFKNGDGYILRENSLHGGNPVKKGEKIGLNIWILG